MIDVSKAIIKDRFQKRYFIELVFRFTGLFTIIITCFFLLVFLVSIIISGIPAFKHTEIRLAVNLQPTLINEHNYNSIIAESFANILPGRKLTNEQIFSVISEGAAYHINDLVKKETASIGKTQEIWLITSDKMKNCILYNRDCTHFRLLCKEILKQRQAIRHIINFDILFNKDSREPEIAGMMGSIIGSLLTVFICMVIAFPLSLLTSVYLEEFAPKNKLTAFIEININNLAAVPSIVFGIVGLAIFLGIFNLPRSSSLVAGLTLSFMALPTLIITTRQAISSVPHNLKLGGMALGASKIQILCHHTLKYALPGILTGAVLTICRVIGETAPLIMIGMVAFIADIPQGFLDPATVMPVQIYLWAESPEASFKAKTAAAIIILLAIVFLINILTVILRKKYEHKW